MPTAPLIFVLGSPRSGTSALTRVLSLCGCCLPPSVAAANECNPRGYWESLDTIKLYASFLLRNGTAFFDPSFRLFEDLIGEKDRESYLCEIQEFLSQLPVGPALVLKDVSISFLMEYWHEAAARSGFDAKAVLAIRHPAEAVSSYIELMRFTSKKYSEIKAPSPDVVTANWLKLNLLAERQTRTLPRVFVSYENLISDWRREVSRISTALAVPLTPLRAAIGDFLTADLRHHRSSGPVDEPFAYHWVSTVYAQLIAACENASVDTGVLDEIYEAYRANERIFRVSWQDFCEAFEVTKKLMSSTLEPVPVWTHGVDY